MKTKLITRVKALSSSAKARMMARMIAVTIVTLSGVFAYSGVALADGADLDGVVSPIVDLINSFVNPMLALVAAGGTLFCIMLGVKFATAEEPQEKEKRTHQVMDVKCMKNVKMVPKLVFAQSKVVDMLKVTDNKDGHLLNNSPFHKFH